jgi:adenine phosphoribosyltransferase
VFLDIFPILRNPLAFETLITHLMHHITSYTIPSSNFKKIDVVVGLDARGFLLGPIIAQRLGASFVPVRKKGKLPGKVHQAEYAKEYGVVRIFAYRSFPSHVLNVACLGLVRNAGRCYTFRQQRDRCRRLDCNRSIHLDSNIAVFCLMTDTCWLTGGSASAAGQLVREQGGHTLEYLFVISLPFLNGHDKLDAPAYSVIQAQD